MGGPQQGPDPGLIPLPILFWKPLFSTVKELSCGGTITPLLILERTPTTQTTATSEVQLIKTLSPLYSRHSELSNVQSSGILKLSSGPHPGSGNFPDGRSEENSQLQVLFPGSCRLKADQGMIFHTILYNAIVKSCIIICKIYPITVTMALDTKQN